MSNQPVLGDDNVHATGPSAPAPEERFWRRYSPHHEFPLSGATSVAVHTLAVAVILVGGFLLTKLDRDGGKGHIPVGVVEVDPGGGEGTGQKPGGPGDLVHGSNELVDRKPPPAPTTLDPFSGKPIRKPSPNLPVAPQAKNDDRLLADEAAAADRPLDDRNQELKRKLRDLTGRTDDPGQGGTNDPDGRGNGKPAGDGTGNKGPRIGTTPRELRWVLLFDTLNGDDYRKQLHDLGAILAVPEKEGTYRVIRDLTHVPAGGKVEDLKTIKRIFWVDDKPQSVASLSRALGMDRPPAHIVAFFPQQLEDELLDKELKYRGRSEKEIKETRFRIVKHGPKYDAEVIDQR